ncbi:hypothetical protein NQZ79_g5700 [Umbelopsis isabellina]|nr:hypothetical protein NQZ79_g5700 [Umbelopsis isabellina]
MLNSCLTKLKLVEFKGQPAIDRMDGGDDMNATSATPSPPGTPNFRNSQSNTPVQDVDDIIPTAIVIKNIPFSVKKDVLITIMNSMDLPQPHAFNYHFDNGIFRGLAFANYRNREETDLVIQTLNGLDLGGRKLRVEYKKMLPGQEREIYLSDDVRDSLSPSSSSRLSSKKDGMNEKRDSRNSPRPKSGSEQEPNPEDGPLDLNHPDTLLFYDQLFQFRSDPSRDIFIYPKSTSSKQRRIIHYLADRLGLYHYSDGDGSERQIHIVKKPANAAQLRGDSVGRRSSQRGTRNRLRQSQSQDRVRDSDNGSPPRRDNYRRSFVSSSPLSDSSGTNTPNVMYPIRQPIGPAPEKNFASRSANLTRKMSQLNLDAPAFEPAGLSQ